MTKEQMSELIGMAELRAFIDSLTPDELRTIRSIINGKLSKRKITSEQQAKMQAARKRKDI